MKKQVEEGEIIVCRLCQYRWRYKGKRERAMCPRCHGYTYVKTWRLYYLFLNARSNR
jgi:RNA polymerase subunit RPABC4/transcription elongation factor Spt4